MSRLHICNTFFERELETGRDLSLKGWLESHPIVAQLQFLPLLYAAPQDRILVTHLPENPDPRLCLIDNPACLPIEHWGPSKAIANWAKKWGIPYSCPDWEEIRRVNSKIFSFTNSPQLPGAKLLYNAEELEEWLAQTPGPKVLKTPFGTAGNGHFRPDVKRLYKYPMIGEPWVERVLDFSTQWHNGKLLGVTVFETGETGRYLGTVAKEVENWALEEHLKVAKPLVERMNYPGHLGIDAFIYLDRGEKKVHPVVEINGRKTMSWVALERGAQKLYYTSGKEGVLPARLGNREFSKNIQIEDIWKC
jgi:hypothetical protein